MKFGLVGTAHWSSEIHAPGLANAPGATFVGVWGRDRNKAAQLAKTHGVKVYDDFDNLLEEVDAISFAVPPDIQAALGKTAAQRGKHLLLEKPLALTLRDGEALSESINASGVRSVIFLSRLFHPKLRSHIAQAAQAQGLTHGRVRIVSNSMRVLSPYSNSRWRRTPRAALWDLGPHALSVLQSVLGGVARINAKFDAKAHILLHAHHESGASSFAELSLTAMDEDLVNDTTFYCSEGEIALPQIDMINGGAAEAYQEAIRRLLTADRMAPYCDASYGLQVLRLLTECDEQLGIFDRP